MSYGVFWLKKIGGVKPPREFVLMDRAAVGLGSVFMHLKAEINWYRVFHELISEFDENKLAKKQKSLLTKVGHNFKWLFEEYHLKIFLHHHKSF